MGCHFLLQGIFPTQGLNPGLLYCRLYWLSYLGSPLYFVLCQCPLYILIVLQIFIDDLSLSFVITELNVLYLTLCGFLYSGSCDRLWFISCDSLFFFLHINFKVVLFLGTEHFILRERLHCFYSFYLFSFKTTLSAISVVPQTFFWLVFAWYIFFSPVTLIFLYLCDIAEFLVRNL